MSPAPRVLRSRGQERPTSPAVRRPIRRPGADAAAPLSSAALLQLIWLASPALPVGGFSYSEGLESAVDTGRVDGEASATLWLLDQLRLGLSRAELPVVARAFDAWCRRDVDAIRALNAWITTTRESSELRLQTEQMGRSLVEWLKNRGGAADDPRVAELKSLSPAPTWPVAYALAAAQTGAPRQPALLAFGFGWAENMVQAALKTVPLGQAAGQRVLAALAAALPAAVDAAMRQAAGGRQAFTPMLAILSAQHETQYSRLFRS